MEVTLRPSNSGDANFARDIHHGAYYDVCVAQFGPWDEAAQDQYFQRDWANAVPEIVLYNGVPCGYTCIEERAEDILVRELVIHPDYQNRGIGTALLRQVLERAQERFVPVRLGTQQKNRAFHLYRKLGFEEFERTPTHILMQWEPRLHTEESR